MLLPHLKLFFFKKKGLKLVFLSNFLDDVWRQIFLLLHSTNWPNFNVWLLLLCEILGNMCIVIVSLPGCDVITFEIKLVFLIKSSFSSWPKIQEKNLNKLRTKRTKRSHKKHFSSILKGFQWSKWNNYFLEGKSPTLKGSNKDALLTWKNFIV